MKLFKRKTLPLLHWKDITIARHKAIIGVYEKYNGADDLTFFPYDLVCAAYGRSEEWMNNLKISEANEWVNSIEPLGHRPKPAPVRQSYTLNGKVYRPVLNMQALSTSQYIDFQQLADKSREMPAEFLSILLLPDGHKYNDGYDMAEVVNDIENFMSVEDCLGLTAFFFDLLVISIKASIRRLKREERKARKEGLLTPEQSEALKRVTDLLESVGGLRR